MESDKVKRKRTPKSKELTRRAREENIREFQRRRKGEEAKAPAKKATTKPKKDGVREIRRRLRPQKDAAEKARRPFMVLKPTEKMLAEREYELPEALAKSYLEEAGYGDKSLRERGDSGQKNLQFGNVNDCPRMVNYKFFSPHRARDYTVKGLILFDDGKMHHRNIQRRLEDCGMGRKPEGYLTLPSCGAVGYYDQLINVGMDRGWRICDLAEYKTRFPYACEEIGQDAYNQGQLYHFAAKRSERLQARKIKIRNVRIMNRDRAVQTDEVHFSWMVQPDKARQTECVEYMEWLYEKVILEHYLPPQPYEPSSTDCTYCRWKDWCWHEYPEIIVSEGELIPVPVPDREIVESHAKRIYEILRLESELRQEKDKIAPVILTYLKEQKRPVFPVTEDVGLMPQQSRITVWDKKALIKKIGLESFALVADVKGTLVTDYIQREYVDAGMFEKVKKYKLSKPYLKIAKLKKFEKKKQDDDGK